MAAESGYHLDIAVIYRPLLRFSVDWVQDRHPDRLRQEDMESVVRCECCTMRIRPVAHHVRCTTQLLMSKSEDSKVKREHSDSDDDGTASGSVAKSKVIPLCVVIALCYVLIVLSNHTKDSRKVDTDDGEMDIVDVDDDTMCSEGSCISVL